MIIVLEIELLNSHAYLANELSHYKLEKVVAKIMHY